MTRSAVEERQIEPLDPDRFVRERLLLPACRDRDSSSVPMITSAARAVVAWHNHEVSRSPIRFFLGCSLALVGCNSRSQGLTTPDTGTAYTTDAEAADAAEAPADYGCGLAPYGSCFFGDAVVQHFDAVRKCLDAPETYVGLCVNGEAVDPRRCAAASLGPACAIAPDGGIYLAKLRGDEYFSAPGWRTDHYPASGPPRPAGTDATPEEYAQCYFASCAPPCPGVEDSHLMPSFDCPADAGSAGVTDAADAG